MKINYSIYLQEFKNLDKNVFIDIAKNNIADFNNYDVVYEEENTRWRIAWNKVEYVNNEGENTYFYSNFIFIAPFEIKYLFSGDYFNLNKEICSYIESCPHYAQAFIEENNDINNEIENFNI